METVFIRSGDDEEDMSCPPPIPPDIPDDMLDAIIFLFPGYPGGKDDDPICDMKG